MDFRPCILNDDIYRYRYPLLGHPFEQVYLTLTVGIHIASLAVDVWWLESERSGTKWSGMHRRLMYPTMWPVLSSLNITLVSTHRGSKEYLLRIYSVLNL